MQKNAIKEWALYTDLNKWMSSFKVKFRSFRCLVLIKKNDSMHLESQRIKSIIEILKSNENNLTGTVQKVLRKVIKVAN